MPPLGTGRAGGRGWGARAGAVGSWARAHAGRAGVGTTGAQAGVGARGAGRERAGRAAWACGARGLGVPVRMVGMLAGSAGPVWVLVNLARF